MPPTNTKKNNALKLPAIPPTLLALSDVCVLVEFEELTMVSQYVVGHCSHVCVVMAHCSFVWHLGHAGTLLQTTHPRASNLPNDDTVRS